MFFIASIEIDTFFEQSKPLLYKPSTYKNNLCSFLNISQSSCFLLKLIATMVFTRPMWIIWC